MKSETIHVEKSGTLQELLVDMETRPVELTVTGKLNSVDLKYLNGGQGKIASVKTLDLSDVTFDYDNGMYATHKLGNSDLGMGTYTAEFYLSSECRVDTTSSATGLGGGKVVYSIYSDNLSGAFIGNPSLTKVVLPKSLQSIGSYIFRESVIEDVEFGDKIDRISDQAFYKTENLKSISFSPNVTCIGTASFSWSSIEKIVAPALEEIGDKAFTNSKISSIDLSHVKTLGASAFDYAKNLSGTIDLSNVEDIPYRGFYSTPITGAVFGKNLKTMGESAFEFCEDLKSVSLPEGLLSIGICALKCGITSMNVPSTVEQIGLGALNNYWLYQQPTENGVWYFGKVAYGYNDDAPCEELRIKDGIVSVSGGFAAHSKPILATSLKKLILPESLTMIGEITAVNYSGAFTGLESLESVNLPDKLSVIGNRSFKDCGKLSVDSWPSDLKQIGQYAFYGCASIYNLTLPEDFELLGHNSFSGCNSLSSIKIYASDLKIDGSPFGANNSYPNRSIEKVTFGSKVRNIPDYLFYYCNSLIRVVFEGIPETTISRSQPSDPGLTIGECAFGFCTSLSSFTLPEYTSKVGDRAFGSVPLKTVYCYVKTPLSIAGSEMFTAKKQTTIYVPEESLSSYLADPVWSQCDLQAMHVAAGIDDIVISASDYVEIYDFAGVRLYKGTFYNATLPSGVYIVKRSDGVYKIKL